jgi:hypothetical protein
MNSIRSANYSQRRRPARRRVAKISVHPSACEQDGLPPAGLEEFSTHEGFTTQFHDES